MIRIALPSKIDSILSEAVQEAGFTPSFGKCPAIIQWVDTCRGSDTNVLVPEYTILNKIPFSDVLCHNTSFCRLVQKMKLIFPQLYDFIPKTFILPFRNTEFLQKVKKGKKEYFYKHDYPPIGRKKSILNPCDYLVMGEALAIGQECIDTVLIDMQKFEVTFFVLILSINPLQIFVYRDGVVTLHPGDFTHLISSESEADFRKEPENKRVLLSDVFPQFVEEFGIKKDRFWASIDHTVVLSIISAYKYLVAGSRPSVPYCRNFQIMSFNIIFNTDWKPFVVSIDPNIDLTFYSSKERRMKTEIVRDALLLAVPQSEPQEICTARGFWFDDLSWKEFVTCHPSLIDTINTRRAFLLSKMKFGQAFPIEGKDKQMYDRVRSKVLQIYADNIPGMNK